MNKTPNKAYIKGRAFEYAVRDYYEEKGFVVFRTAGSHSPADLIAFPPIDQWFRGRKLDYIPILIQCKNTKKPVSKKELETLHNLADALGLNAVLASKSSSRTLIIEEICKGMELIGE